MEAGNISAGNTGSKIAPKTMGVLLIFAAIVLVIIGVIRMVWTNNYISKCTAETTGSIVKVSHVLNFRKGSTRYRWKISYTAEDGTEYTFKTGKTSQTPENGDTVTVYYDPDKPTRRYISEVPPDDGAGDYVAAGVCLILGLTGVFYKPKTPPSANLGNTNITAGETQNKTQ